MSNKNLISLRNITLILIGKAHGAFRQRTEVFELTYIIETL